MSRSRRRRAPAAAPTGPLTRPHGTGRAAADDAEGRVTRRRPRAGAGRHRAHAADHRAGHDGPEHRRQDRRPEDRRPAGADGAGGPARARRGRVAPAGVPIDLRRHRRRAVDCREPEHVLVARHQHRRRWTGRSRCPRSCCSTRSARAPTRSRAARSAWRSSTTSAQRGAIVIATTHSDALKSYASTTAGVVSAAFGFDAGTFAPTYRLVYGSPGRSLALEIAGRLGVNPSILEAARQNLSAREAQLAEHLAKIDQDLHALEHERRLVAREHQMLGDAEARMRAREEALRQREDAAKRRLDEQLDERLRRGAARDRPDRRRPEAAHRRTGRAGRAARPPAGAGGVDRRCGQRPGGGARRPSRPSSTRAGSAGGRGASRRSRRRPAHGQPVVGDRVVVPGLGLEGTLAAIHDHEGEVDVQGKRVRAPLGELRVLSRGSAPAPARVSVNVQVQPREGVPTRSQRDRVLGRRGADARRAVPRRLRC